MPRVVLALPGGSVQQNAFLGCAGLRRRRQDSVVQPRRDAITENRGEQRALTVDGMLITRHLHGPTVSQSGGPFPSRRVGIAGLDCAPGQGRHHAALDEPLSIQNHVVAPLPKRTDEVGQLPTGRAQRAAPTSPGNGQHLAHRRVQGGDVSKGFLNDPVKRHALAGGIGHCRQRMDHVSHRRHLDQ